ncbi:type II toxin-antitoxin system HicB family antitoxin [Crocosphaera sp. Alani8]|uniref:type II toxin-antitoxin system HicB family antitoxin n=1 Tax=Crocosphaera sp. Alani8 TaxID=3038952 RepID=UPI00313AAA58
MENKYTAIIKKDGDWWIGWIEEIKGVNAQESTREELIESLKEALKDILQLNREEARTEAIENYEEVMITL